MKFLRSLMEAAKPEAEKSPISKADLRTYQSQIKKTFHGDEKFKSGKTSRGKFAAAAMDCMDNCPKHGNTGEHHKSAAVKHMWDGYRAKHDGLKEGYLVEGWDEDESDEDVKRAEAFDKKTGKGLSKRAEEALHRKLDKKDKKAEDKASKVKSKEEVTEAVETPATSAEAVKGGFAEFLKQK